MNKYLFLGITLLLISCQKKQENPILTHIKVQKIIQTIKIPKNSFLHQKIKEPEPGDWTFGHKEEGQPFHDYIQINPVRGHRERNKIYLLPLGHFDPTEQKLLNSCAKYLKVYFGMEVIVQKETDIAQIPNSARRYRQENGLTWEQILTKYVMYEMLLPKIPQDAIAYMAVSKYDLYPEDSWNFVFGQASTRQKVGVSSFQRYITPDWQKDEKQFQLVLMRLMKTTTHEIGHMLSILHCIYYECNMNGSNSLEESDRKPAYLCPICVSKLSWNLNYDLRERYKNLAAYFEKNDFEVEQQFCIKSIAFLDSLQAQCSQPWTPALEYELFIQVHDQAIRK
ncbi:MAG: archaemetzincin [Microscillaceae bacterium]|nr:archaemetzincin [Microscillaceae bacterium]